MSVDYTFSSELFFEELMRISKDLVWKNPTKALAHEDEEYSIEVEQYILSIQNRLVFSIVYQFSEEVLRSFGLSDELVVKYMNDKDEIPIENRDVYTKRQMEWNIQNYVEHNNYYRMLHGLPDEEDKDYYYNTLYPDISDSDTPIHELSLSQLHMLENVGYIDQLIKMHPDKKYLTHMTNRKIDYYTARNSKPYSILWIGESDFDNLTTDFQDTYNECRTMLTTIFYQKVMNSSNPEYAGFMGMMILFQTINLMQKNFLNADMTRDFYDVESLRLVYDSYDIPFYSNIPLEYHKKIVKNINILLSHKGSTRVFYDLFDIFDFDGMSIYSYYMIKTRRFDKNGKPIFSYNEDGTYNNKAMYDIKFSKVKLYNDPILEMRDPKNHVDYQEMIRNDKYWINDKDLLNKIYDEEFNFMESKYLGVQTTFNLMKIVYETTYYLKMLLDNRKLLNTTYMYNSSIHMDINLYDMVIYTCALIMKKYGYAGNIPVELHEIGSVMGFNFKTDLEVLKKNIAEDDYLKNDKTLLNCLSTMDVSSLASVKKVYNNLTTLRNYLIRKMSETDDVPTYWSYYNLYQTLMYSEYTQDTFTKSDGTIADSFEDMLKDCNPSLYDRYFVIGEDDIEGEVADMLYLIKSSCNSLKHIEYAESVNIDTIIEYVFKLLEFFKSAKADLTGYEIVYSLVSSGENILKMMDYFSYIHEEFPDPIYSIFDEFDDMLSIIKGRMDLLDKFTLMDEAYSFETNIIKDIIEYLKDELIYLSEIFYDLFSSTEFLDDFSNIRDITLLPSEDFKIKDMMIPLYEEIKEILKFRIYDEFPIIDRILSFVEKTKDIQLEDKIRCISKIALVLYSMHIGDSSYKLEDYLIDSGSTDYMEDQYWLVDSIIKIFEKHRHFTLNIYPQDIIKKIDTKIHVTDSEFGIQDTDPCIQEIFLILSDIKQDKVMYLDELTISYIRSFLKSEFRLHENMTIKEICDFMYSKIPFMESYIKEIQDKDQNESLSLFQDSIRLISEQKFED